MPLDAVLPQKANALHVAIATVHGMQQTSRRGPRILLCPTCWSYTSKNHRRQSDLTLGWTGVDYDLDSKANDTPAR